MVRVMNACMKNVELDRVNGLKRWLNNFPEQDNYISYSSARVNDKQMKCEVVEYVKRNTLWWFGHIEIKWRVCEVYASETDVPSRGKSVVRWKDRVKEYMHEEMQIDGEGLK